MRGDLDELRRERGGTHTNYSDCQQESLGAAFKRVSDAKARLAVKYEQLHIRVKELEQQRTAALKLADEFSNRGDFAAERGCSVLASAWYGGAEQLGAIFTPKERA